jgi:hypothetical protein
MPFKKRGIVQMTCIALCYQKRTPLPCRLAYFGCLVADENHHDPHSPSVCSGTLSEKSLEAHVWLRSLFDPGDELHKLPFQVS